MVRTRLHAELQALSQRVPEESCGPKATVNWNQEIRRLSQRSALVFVVCVITLVQLNQRLQFRVVVAPVCPLARGQGMFHAYSPVLAQIRVKNRTRIQLALVLFQGYRERANAAVIEDDVAMAVGISDASLITKKR